MVWCGWFPQKQSDAHLVLGDRCACWISSSAWTTQRTSTGIVIDITACFSYQFFLGTVQPFLQLDDIILLDTWNIIERIQWMNPTTTWAITKRLPVKKWYCKSAKKFLHLLARIRGQLHATKTKESNDDCHRWRPNTAEGGEHTGISDISRYVVSARSSCLSSSMTSCLMRSRSEAVERCKIKEMIIVLHFLCNFRGINLLFLQMTWHGVKSLTRLFGLGFCLGGPLTTLLANRKTGEISTS